MRNLKALNSALGLVFCAIGLFLPSVEFIRVLQAPGDHAYLLIQGHWIAAGAISIWSAHSKKRSLLNLSVVFIMATVSGFLAVIAILGNHWDFSWIFAFAALSVLNIVQLDADFRLADAADKEDAVHDELVTDQSKIPPDYFEIRSPGSAGMIHGILNIVLLTVLPAGAVIGVFFYIDLMANVIFHGSEVDLEKVPSDLIADFSSILHIILVSAAVYLIILIIQLIVEKLATTSREQTSDDVNRALSLQERTFIWNHLDKLQDHRKFVKYPRVFVVMYWSSVAAGLVLMIGVPAANAILQVLLFDPVKLAGLSQGVVITALGPAFVGGVVFGVLFGAATSVSIFQWLGKKHPLFGEYLHSKVGWNSMSNKARTIHEYGKIFTRFVRLRRYEPDQLIEPRNFLFDAFNEYAQVTYKVTLWLAVAMCVFTVLDVNWRRVAHTEGFHYSSYLDLRAHDLSLDEVISVKLKCFRFNEDDNGVAQLGTGYVLVFANNIKVDLLGRAIDEEVLAKVEHVDAALRRNDVSFERVKRLGNLLLRDRTGFIAECEDAVSVEHPPQIADRLWGLIGGS